jgi:hypothetical protein
MAEAELEGASSQIRQLVSVRKQGPKKLYSREQRQKIGGWRRDSGVISNPRFTCAKMTVLHVLPLTTKQHFEHVVEHSELGTNGGEQGAVVLSFFY